MVEAASRHHRMAWRYVNCEVPPERLADAVRGARAMGWAGFNCSLPHKVTVIEHLDHLGASAQIIGAVNTVVVRDGLLVGENTDGQGFVEALRPVCSIEGQRVVLFGAGGAARAVAVELAFSYATARTAVRVSREGWAFAAVRLTWKPLAGAVVCAVLLGATIDYFLPTAKSLPQALKMMGATR